jgi:hypothetical protein
MPTVIKDLLRGLIAIDLQSSFHPLWRLTLLSKKTPGKYEGASVFEQVVPEEMRFKIPIEIAGLAVQTAYEVFSLESRLTPVYDAE